MSLNPNIGFLDFGVVASTPVGAEFDHFRQYISEGRNAAMHYLSANMDKRENPSLLVEGAKSILCFLAPYGNRGNAVASFALGEDYHKVIKDKLFAVMQYLSDEMSLRGGEPFVGRAFTDSAPVLERYWAAKASLGFIGKNNFLISPRFGLRTLIGVIICNIPPEMFEPHAPLPEGCSCGECRKCLDACPDGALRAAYTLDARRCISYHTIEHRELYDSHPIDYHGQLFGCERCIKVCPWNKETPSWSEFETNADYLLSLTHEKWLAMNEATFHEKFKNTSLQRAGLAKIKNNIK